MANRFVTTFIMCGTILTALPNAARENVQAQEVPTKPSEKKAAPTGPSFYEDDEVKVRIPRNWRARPAAEKSHGPLLIEKDHYTLSLAYHTSQASGIIGGRFSEIFTIPWLGGDDAWTCSESLNRDPWPASRQLMFVNLTLDSDDARVRKNCGISKPLGKWVVENGQKQYVGDRRWFGGYFTGMGGYFFANGGRDDDCGSKAYTLTSQATRPNQLPNAIIGLPDKEPELTKVIEEAIDIVNSIHYKRCSPF